MNQHSSPQQKHSGSAQPGSSSQPPASGQSVRHVLIPSRFNVRRRVRRGLAGVLFWLFVACAATALMNGVEDQYDKLQLLDWLKGSRLRWFLSIWIPGVAASIALIVASERVTWIEVGLEKLEAWIIRNQQGLWASMLLTVVTTIALLIANNPPIPTPPIPPSPPPIPPSPPPIPPSPPPTATNTPITVTPTFTPITITPTFTGTPLAVTPPPSTPHDSLIVLCASNAKQHDPVGDRNDDIQPEAYHSLSRYHTNPSLRSLVAKLYPQQAYPILYPNCSNDQQIVSTERMGPFADEKIVLFPNPSASRIPIKSIWVLMAASNSAGFVSNNLEIGQIQARFLGKNSDVHLASLELGKNIADWQFRGKPVGLAREHETIADFNIQSGNGTQTLRLLADYEVDNSTIIRAAQLFAIQAPIPQEASLGALQSVRIKDLPGGPGLDMLAVVLVPADLPEQADGLPNASVPLCLQQVTVDSRNVAKRDFRQDVAAERTYNIAPGCDPHQPVTLDDVAPNVDFYFDKIVATQPDDPHSPNTNPSEIVINVTNSISATHLYLIMSARNLCVTEAAAIGTITIKETSKQTGPVYNLIAGDNIRQGRTNLSDANCDSGEEVLSMRDPDEQQSTGQEIVGLRGVPLRATPNSWTELKPAELWFDLIKVEIPADREFLTITIHDNTQHAPNTITPFITLYAASLVREPR